MTVGTQVLMVMVESETGLDEAPAADEAGAEDAGGTMIEVLE